MPQNGINHPGVMALAQAFAINPLLRVINLNDNTFTEKGGVAMAEVRRVYRASMALPLPFHPSMLNLHRIGLCVTRSLQANAEWPLGGKGS